MHCVFCGSADYYNYGYCKPCWALIPENEQTDLWIKKGAMPQDDYSAIIALASLAIEQQGYRFVFSEPVSLRPGKAARNRSSNRIR